MNVLLTAALVAATISSAFAQTTDSTTTSAATQAAPAGGLTVSGYVEAYYSHDFTLAKTAQERPAFLYNHRRNREVNINLAYVKVAYLNDAGADHPVRANLALQVGTYAQYNYAAEQGLLRNVFEANAGVKLSQNRDLWLDAGIFSSHIGFESAISKDCWTLTRSLQAENSPYYLSGAKLTYNTGTPDRPNGQWTFLLSVLNGWQRIAKLPGYSGMAISTQVQYRPSNKLTLNWSSFLGSDRPDSLRQGRFFNNLYAIINPQGRFGVILGFDIGADRKPVIRTGSDVRVDGGGSYVWYSPVVIARYKTSDKTYVNGRVEYYDDKNGVIVGLPGFQTLGYSLGYDYAILPNRGAGSALLRVEGKVYDSQTPIFEGKRVNTSLTTSLAVSF